MSAELPYGSATDIGRARKANEDSILVQPPLFAVADGMGGHSAGDVASQTAVEALAHEVGVEHNSLAEAVKEANRRVFDRAQQSTALTGMGTTMTAVLTSDSRVEIAHVGDSRAYMLRGGRLNRLTTDHTVMERMVRQGKLRPEEARNHPQRSVLERALGVEPDVKIDVQTVDVRPGDRLLLCSDGLTGMLEEREILQILEEEPDPAAASRRLVAEANDAGGHDNISVIVVDFPSSGITLDSASPSDTVVADEHPPIAETPSWISPSPSDVEPTDPPPPPSWSIPPSPPAWSGLPDPPPPRPSTGRPHVPAPPPPETPAAPAGETVDSGRNRRILRRGLIAVAVLALLLAGGAVARSALLNSWYVGESGGNVAIFRGVPGSIAGLKVSKLEKRTDLMVSSLIEIEQERVREGKTAGSRREAEKIVAALQSQPEPSPVLSPSPSPAGSPGPEPNPVVSPS